MIEDEEDSLVLSIDGVLFQFLGLYEFIEVMTKEGDCVVFQGRE
jgi:hypothetical protein